MCASRRNRERSRGRTGPPLHVPQALHATAPTGCRSAREAGRLAVPRHLCVVARVLHSCVPPPPFSHGGRCTPATLPQASRQAPPRPHTNKERRDAIDGQSCARIHQDCALRPSVLKRPNADGSASSRRTICGELIACYDTDETLSPILHTRTRPVSACAMRQSLRPSLRRQRGGGEDTQGGAAGRRAAWALGRGETE